VSDTTSVVVVGEQARPHLLTGVGTNDPVGAMVTFTAVALVGVGAGEGGEAVGDDVVLGKRDEVFAIVGITVGACYQIKDNGPHIQATSPHRQ